MNNQEGRPVIPDAAWDVFIETGELDVDFFLLIAHRMTFNIDLTDREHAIYIAYPQEIEACLSRL